MPPWSDAYMAMVIGLAVMNVVDVLTGLLGAVKKKNLDSTLFRQGLIKKACYWLAAITAYAVEWLSMFADLGVNLPIFSAVMVAMILCEVLSVVENLCIINPDLKNLGLSEYFTKAKGDDNVSRH